MAGLLLHLLLAVAQGGTFVVASDSGAQCTAHLSVDPGAEEAALVLVMAGTGVYSSADLGDWLDEAVGVGQVAVLTIDKPGVLGVDDSGEVRLDAATFATYQPQDLVDCADQALGWASEQNGVDGDHRILFGHSEGALVSVALLERWRPWNLDGVAGVVLSGTPLFGIGEVLVHQTGAKDLDTALQKLSRRSRRNPERFAQDTGAGWDTLYGWSMVAPPVEVLAMEDVAAVPIVLTHGREDQAVPLDEARWTGALGPHTLRIYEDSGHGGNARMMAQTTDLIRAWAAGTNPAAATDE